MNGTCEDLLQYNQFFFNFKGFKLEKLRSLKSTYEKISSGKGMDIQKGEIIKHLTRHFRLLCASYLIKV